jgi:hypothetical protein
LAPLFPELDRRFRLNLNWSDDGWLASDALYQMAELSERFGPGLCFVQAKDRQAILPALDPDRVEELWDSLPRSGARSLEPKNQASPGRCPLWGPCLGRRIDFADLLLELAEELAKELNDDFRSELAGCPLDCRLSMERADVGLVLAEDGRGLTVWLGGRHRFGHDSVQPAPFRDFSLNEAWPALDLIFWLHDLWYTHRLPRDETLPEMARRLGLDFFNQTSSKRPSGAPDPSPAPIGSKDHSPSPEFSSGEISLNGKSSGKARSKIAPEKDEERITAYPADGGLSQILKWRVMEDPDDAAPATDALREDDSPLARSAPKDPTPLPLNADDIDIVSRDLVLAPPMANLDENKPADSPATLTDSRDLASLPLSLDDYAYSDSVPVAPTIEVSDEDNPADSPAPLTNSRDLSSLPLSLDDYAYGDSNSIVPTIEVSGEDEPAGPQTNSALSANASESADSSDSADSADSASRPLALNGYANGDAPLDAETLSVSPEITPIDVVLVDDDSPSLATDEGKAGEDQYGAPPARTPT